MEQEAVAWPGRILGRLQALEGVRGRPRPAAGAWRHMPDRRIAWSLGFTDGMALERALGRPPVGIMQGEPDLVGGIRLEQYRAAGEELAAGRDDHQARSALRTSLIEIALRAALHAEQGRPLAPGAGTRLAHLHVDLGIGVVIAIDQPIDAQAAQRRRLHHRFTVRLGGIGGGGRCRTRGEERRRREQDCRQAGCDH